MQGRSPKGNELNTSKHTELASHAWSVADFLGGDYMQSGYGKGVFTTSGRGVDEA